MVEDAISFWTDIQRYEDMLVADPRSYCFAPLSELYRKLGLLDDAISVAKRGCDLHPDYPGGFFALGTACYAKGQRDEARGALERAVSLNPDNLQAHKLLGQIYVEAGEMALAEKVLQRVLQQTPDDLETTLLLRSVASQGAPPQPEEEFLEEAELIEDLTEVLDEPLSAETALPSGAASAPPTPPVRAAETAEDFGGFEESDDFWAIEEPEESSAPELLRAFEEIASPEQPAPQQSSRDPLTTATLAELYVTQGFTVKALAIYQELLCADPANETYRSRCAELAELQARQQELLQPAAPAPRPQAPAAQHEVPAAPQEVPAPQEEVPVPQMDAEAELCNWLENIRRRRDGL
ncbi:MAG: hypothetical protein A2075_06835 [Geobacteraceae bacterium GWC2_58_44]|nr:MAG: hypothetical protein A2075_06835 [Geobacteraceae bacterium GWC2_58_44]HBG08270.1 hypothetical protein [Geobacter sp.]